MKWNRLVLAAVSIVLATTIAQAIGTTAGQASSTPVPRLADYRVNALPATPSPTPVPTPVVTPDPTDAPVTRTTTRTQSEPRVAPQPRPPVSGDVWYKLALCESGANPATNTGNGYYGAFQFSASTWRSVGGPGLPHQHPYETQLYYAKRLQARSGWGQWPACSRRLGLR